MDIVENVLMMGYESTMVLEIVNKFKFPFFCGFVDVIVESCCGLCKKNFKVIYTSLIHCFRVKSFYMRQLNCKFWRMLVFWERKRMFIKYIYFNKRNLLFVVLSSRP